MSAYATGTNSPELLAGHHLVEIYGRPSQQCSTEHLDSRDGKGTVEQAIQQEGFLSAEWCELPKYRLESDEKDGSGNFNPSPKIPVAMNVVGCWAADAMHDVEKIVILTDNKSGVRIFSRGGQEAKGN